MSTDSTELQFIRCPSCRSLIPVSSPRCRMCGTTLDMGKPDAGKSAEDEAARKAASRVRQQTVAVSENEVEAAKEQFSQNASETINVNSVEPVERQDTLNYASGFGSVSEESESPDFEDFGDPLGAFIQEVPVDEPEDETVNGFHGEETVSDALSAANEEVTDEDDEEFSVPVSPITSSKKTDLTEPKMEARPRVVIESGQRKQQKGGLSFGKKDKKEFAPRTEKPVNKIVRQPVAPEERIFEEESVMESSSHEYTKEVPVSKPAVKIPAPKPVGEVVKGRLMGWLVSYSDPRGIATELREGAFFVSRSSLKGTELILDDDSISTPHALFSVGSDISIQDLISERGIFVRAREGEAYQKISESTKLEHGNWVRFGDVEFLVVIIS